MDTALLNFLHGDPYTLSEIGLEEDNITIVGNNLANGNEISVFINIETATTILTSENPESDDNTITLPEAIDIFQEVVSIASALLIDSFETEINY